MYCNVMILYTKILLSSQNSGQALASWVGSWLSAGVDPRWGWEWQCWLGQLGACSHCGTCTVSVVPGWPWQMPGGSASQQMGAFSPSLCLWLAKRY